MSKGDFRVFKLEEKNDFIIYLWSLIISVDKHLVQYKKYLHQLETAITEYKLLLEPTCKIPMDIYEELNDKIQKRTGHLLNLIGDHTVEGISYKRFRSIVASCRKKGIDYGLAELDKKLISAINDFHNSRNWGMHEPASLLNAQLEKIGEVTGQDPKQYLLGRIIPEISWHDFEYYQGEWLLSLWAESKHVYDGFRMVHQQMKKDYSILVGDNVRIRRIRTELRPFESEIDLPRISMEMQSGRYTSKSDATHDKEDE